MAHCPMERCCYQRPSASICNAIHCVLSRALSKEARPVDYLQDPSHRKAFSVVMTFLRMVTRGGSCLAMNPDGTIRGCQ